MALTRDERREQDPQWQQFEIELAKLKGFASTSPEAVMRMTVSSRENAHVIWRLLTDEEKGLVAISWTEAHYLSRHPAWVARMELDPEPSDHFDLSGHRAGVTSGIPDLPAKERV